MDLRLPYYMMYPIPYAFDEEKIQKRDREYLQSMYPATAKKIFPYIQEECDRQEYEGSMIYDEYPDKLQLCLMCRRAYEQVMKQEKWEKETYSGTDPGDRRNFDVPGIDGKKRKRQAATGKNSCFMHRTCAIISSDIKMTASETQFR